MTRISSSASLLIRGAHRALILNLGLPPPPRRDRAASPARAPAASAVPTRAPLAGSETDASQDKRPDSDTTTTLLINATRGPSRHINLPLSATVCTVPQVASFDNLFAGAGTTAKLLADFKTVSTLVIGSEHNSVTVNTSLTPACPLPGVGRGSVIRLETCAFVSLIGPHVPPPPTAAPPQAPLLVVKYLLKLKSPSSTISLSVPSVELCRMTGATGSSPSKGVGVRRQSSPIGWQTEMQPSSLRAKMASISPLKSYLSPALFRMRRTSRLAPERAPFTGTRSSSVL